MTAARDGAFPRRTRLTSVVKTAPGYAEMAQNPRSSSDPGVAETALDLRRREAPDEILATSWLLKAVEGTTREDGTTAVYLSTAPQTTIPTGARQRPMPRVALAAATVWRPRTSSKANVPASRRRLPPHPVPLDFDDDGAALDLEALGADGAVLATGWRRPRRHVARRHPRRGAARSSALHAARPSPAGDRASRRRSTSAAAAAPNAWLFIDPDDPTPRVDVPRGVSRGPRRLPAEDPRGETRVQAHPGTAEVDRRSPCERTMVGSRRRGGVLQHRRRLRRTGRRRRPKSPRAEMFEPNSTSRFARRARARRWNRCSPSLVPRRPAASFAHRHREAKRQRTKTGAALGIGRSRELRTIAGSASKGQRRSASTARRAIRAFETMFTSFARPVARSHRRHRRERPLARVRRRRRFDIHPSELAARDVAPRPKTFRGDARAAGADVDLARADPRRTSPSSPKSPRDRCAVA